MAKLLILLTLLPLASCAGFQAKASQTLAATQQAAISARETLLPIVNGYCRAAAEACRELQDEACPALVTCSDVRDKIIDVIIAVHYAILDANTALAIGDETSTWAAIDKALELIRQLRVQMQELGIGA